MMSAAPDDDSYGLLWLEPGYGAYIAAEQSDIRKYTAYKRRMARRDEAFRAAAHTWETIIESLRRAA